MVHKIRKTELTYNPTRRKKRYSNFHRARKWHRKFRNVLYDPNGVRIWLVDHYSDLYEKYERKAERTDGVVIDCVGPGSKAKLFIVKHHGPTSIFVEKWRSFLYHSGDDNLSRTLE